MSIQKDKKQYAENVTMTVKEHDKLVSLHGQNYTERYIIKLDNYKGASGKEYRSDYRAILLWVVEAVGTGKKIKKKRPLESLKYDADKCAGLYFENGRCTKQEETKEKEICDVCEKKPTTGGSCED